MTYGYCRISTPQQNIDRQIRNILAAYPDAQLFCEAYTGKVITRPVFDKLLRKLQPGDLVVFDSVSRMSRSAAEGLELYEDLMQRGIELVFLNEPHINTATYRAAMADGVGMVGDEVVDAVLAGVNKALAILRRRQIQQAFDQAQKELDDLSSRTKQGIETARRAGKQIGQPSGATWETDKARQAKEIIQRHARIFGGNLSDIEVMKLAGVSRNSYYKYKAELTRG